MTVRARHRPTHRETLWELEAALDRGDLVSIFGRCTVEYDGRAASTLDSGDRLLLLKPDGSALVHTDEKRTPINWQPPGCEHHASVRDGRLRVRSVRSTPSETLDVRFSSVEQFCAYNITGGRDVDVVGSEEDLKRHIVENPDCIEDGFEPIETERETTAGAIDVFGRDVDGRPVVLELKRRRVGPDAAGQLQRYVEAVEAEHPDGTSVRGILVAPSVTDATKDVLDRNDAEFVSISP